MVYFEICGYKIILKIKRCLDNDLDKLIREVDKLKGQMEEVDKFMIDIKRLKIDVKEFYIIFLENQGGGCKCFVYVFIFCLNGYIVCNY